MKKILFIFAIMLFIIITSATSLWAYKNDVKYYLQNKNDLVLKTYINGVGEGYGWANVENGSAKNPLIYCQPAKLALSGLNYIDIIDRELEAFNYPMDTPIEFVLLMGLKRTFPCKK